MRVPGALERGWVIARANHADSSSAVAGAVAVAGVTIRVGRKGGLMIMRKTEKEKDKEKEKQKQMGSQLRLNG